MSEKKVILQVKGLSKDFQIKGKNLGSKKSGSSCAAGNRLRNS